MNLILVRHGEIPSNVNKIYAGRSPEGLTNKGVIQAKTVAAELKKYKIDAIYSSPIQRAVQTAQIISQAIDVKMYIDDSFREMELGLWEGMSEADIPEQYPDEWRIWNTSPHELQLAKRETLEELLDRVLAGIRDIYNNLFGGNVIVVTHVAIIRVLLLWHAEKGLELYKSVHVPNAKIFNLKINNCPVVY